MSDMFIFLHESMHACMHSSILSSQMLRRIKTIPPPCRHSYAFPFLRNIRPYHATPAHRTDVHPSQGLASELLRKLPGGNGPPSPPSTPPKDGKTDAKGIKLPIPDQQKIKVTPLRAGKQTTGGRISRVAERRLVRRKARKERKKTERARTPPAVERSSEGKRDVSAEEARTRFETVLREFKAGQTVPGDVLADGDDLDQPVPEEMVQGELKNS